MNRPDAVNRPEAEPNGSAESMKRPVRQYTIAVADGRQLVLAVALHGAVGFPGPHRRSDPALGDAAQGLQRNRQRMGKRTRVFRAVEAYHEKYDVTDGDKVVDFLTFDAETRPRSAVASKLHGPTPDPSDRPDGRDVGGHQRGLAGTEALRRTRPGLARRARTAHRAVPGLREADDPQLRWRGRPHHVARPVVLVFQARSAHRTGGQHRPYPGCEIPRPTTRARADRRLARLLPVDRHPAGRVGADRLSLGISRKHQAVARGRSPDSPVRNASIAPVLLRQHRPLARFHQLGLWAPGFVPSGLPT